MPFIPRLTDAGIIGSRYWSAPDNPYYPNYGMPNCTAYAWGRFWEINNQMGHDVKPIGMIGNADQWYNNSVAYQHGVTPKLGAIICFAGGTYGTGHVGVVEEILANGDIVTSNSDYGGAFFRVTTLSLPFGVGFQGFIYNPYTDQPEPTPTIKKRRGFKFNLWGQYAKQRHKRILY